MQKMQQASAFCGHGMDVFSNPMWALQRRTLVFALVCTTMRLFQSYSCRVHFQNYKKNAPRSKSGFVSHYSQSQSIFTRNNSVLSCLPPPQDASQADVSFTIAQKSKSMKVIGYQRDLASPDEILIDLDSSFIMIKALIISVAIMSVLSQTPTASVFL